ncbi:PIN domain-containing protein [Cyanobium sp. ATX 6A2]|uniref:PIN domain-containing protein n=1 Tax=Cyanobium sp. ATX 6A2 TaxID=2823700 RepID=UPI0020CCE972|nr:PIN domain-containing protein [Cyanobium sp. ATX 6A2]MCP9889104.1 PIN domain-containing protein [Cyanobium sp. ATX 6A2]
MSLWLEPAVFPVLLDSCVLYPYELRDVLLEAAHRHLYRVHWSQQILQDTVRNLLADGRTTTEQAARFCAAMERAFPEAVVEPPAGLADQLECDPGDRHVLAAAIAAKAEVIVTLNLRHFPQAVLQPLGVEAVNPDQFLCNMLDLDPITINDCLKTMAARQRNPARTAVVLLQALSRQVPTFASRCMEFQVDRS